MPAASIVIRAKNEARFLDRTLQMVYCQTVRDIEVIVVDSGSVDGTLDIAKRYPTRLVEIPPEAFTFGHSLNVGCREAASDYIVLLSAHAVPCDEAWLSNLLHPFQVDMVAGVGGSDHTWFDGIDTLASKYRYSKTLDVTNYHPKNAAWGFAASNGAVDRRVWQEHEFNEGLMASEDKDWAWRVIRAGYRIVYQPSAAVFHEHELTPLQAYRRAWREHYSYALVMPDLRFGVLDLVRGLIERPRGGLWRAVTSNTAQETPPARLGSGAEWASPPTPPLADSICPIVRLRRKVANTWDVRHYGRHFAPKSRLGRVARRLVVRFMVNLGRYRGLKAGQAAVSDRMGGGGVEGS